MKQVRLINNIVGGSYEDTDRFAGCSLSQNLYADKVEQKADGYFVTSKLISVEGERIALDLSEETGEQNNVGCHGMFEASDGSVFAAFGNKIVRIKKNSVSETYTKEIVYDYGYAILNRIRFAETGGINSHVVWCDGTDFVKAYPLDNTKAEALGVQVPLLFRTPLRVYLTSDEIRKETNYHVQPTFICSLNGSIIINDPETDTWYYTDAYALGGTDYERSVYDLDKDGNIQYESGSSYKVKTKNVRIADEDPSSLNSYLWLDRYSKPRFQTAEFSADKITGMVTCDNMLYVVGEKTIQVYTQESSTDAQGFSSIVFNSFNRNVANLGSKYGDTIVELDGNIVFFGSGSRGERSVFVTNGNNPVRISTNAIEREIEGKRIDDCYAFGFVNNGHKFYVITFPIAERTFVYDFSTSQWHNRTTRKANGEDTYWWPRYCCGLYGKIALARGGEYVIAVLDSKKYDDYRGRVIIKRRTAPVMINNGSPFMLNDIELLWNVGTTKDVNNNAGAKNPVVMLEISDDGGYTFGNGSWGYGGKTGQYTYRTIWRAVGGTGTQYVLRFTISDRVNVEIATSHITFTPLAHF